MHFLKTSSSKCFKQIRHCKQFKKHNGSSPTTHSMGVHQQSFKSKLQVLGFGGRNTLRSNGMNARLNVQDVLKPLSYPVNW